jgi:hypothetical protein
MTASKCEAYKMKIIKGFKHETWNMKLQTWNQKHETSNMKPETSNITTNNKMYLNFEFKKCFTYE